MDWYTFVMSLDLVAGLGILLYYGKRAMDSE